MENSKSHILVVDDDNRIRDLLKEYLSDNSYIVMGGQCQKYYKHSIPKITRKADLESCGRRISITLRCFK